MVSKILSFLENALKSREAYEAPAAHIILKLHKDLEQLCLTKEEIQFKSMIDQKWAYLIYHGAWFHPLKKDLDGFIEASQNVVNGIKLVFTKEISIFLNENLTLDCLTRRFVL